MKHVQTKFWIMTKTVAHQVEYFAYLITQNVMTMYVCFFNILILTVTLTSLHMTQLNLIKCTQRWHAIYTQYITVTSVFISINVNI